MALGDTQWGVMHINVAVTVPSLYSNRTNLRRLKSSGPEVLFVILNQLWTSKIEERAGGQGVTTLLPRA